VLVKLALVATVSRVIDLDHNYVTLSKRALQCKKNTSLNDLNWERVCKKVLYEVGTRSLH
jgi:hypothetical protein